MYCKKCKAKLNPGASFCPKCGTPVVQGDGADNRTGQTKKLLLLGGGGILLVAVIVAGVLLIKGRTTDKVSSQTDGAAASSGSEAASSGYPVVTAEALAAAQSLEMKSPVSFDLEAMEHQPGEKEPGMEWDSDLFYELEGIGSEQMNGIGTLGACTLSQYCLCDTSFGYDVFCEVYTEPASGAVCKITSLREFEDGTLDVTDYYYKDGKPYFVFWRQDTVYTPSYASVKLPGSRFYFENDTMVQVRTVMADLSISQTTLKPQGRSDYEEFDYFTAPDGIRSQYDAYELEWLNRAYNTYEAVVGNEHAAKLCGTVRDQNGEAVSGHHVALQDQDTGEIICCMQTDENGAFAGYVSASGDYQLYVEGGEVYRDLYVHGIEMTQGTCVYEYDDLVLRSSEPQLVSFRLHTVDAVTQNDGQGAGASLLAAQVIIREGSNSRAGQTVYAGNTDENGEVSEILLVSGSYTVEASADGYETTWASLEIDADAPEAYVYLIPTLADGESAFVLTWDEDSGTDLDLTVFTPYAGSDGYMSFINYRANADSQRNHLVSDNTCGCEVVYGYVASGYGALKAYVSDHSALYGGDTASLEKLHARLYIYQSDGQMTECIAGRFADADSGSALVWEAASLRNGAVSGYHRFYPTTAGRACWQRK